MKRLTAMLTVMLLALSLCLTGCGGGAKGGGAAQEKSMPDPALGLYRAEGMMGMTAEEFSSMTGEGSAEDFRNSFQVELKEGGKAMINTDGEPEDIFWSRDGDKIILSDKEKPGEKDEKIEVIVDDGLMILSEDGAEVVLAKAGSEAKAVERIKAAGGENPLAALLGEVESAEAAAGVTESAETEAETTAAESAQAAETTAAVETTAAAEAAKGNAAAKASAQSGDIGKYDIYEYEAAGQKVSHEMLQVAGMGKTYLELKDGGEAELYLFDQKLDCTWEPGVVTVYGTSKYTYTIDGDTLTLDMAGVTYTMKREGGAGASSGGSGAAKTTEAAAETTEAAETTTAAAGTTAAAETTAAAPADAGGGDGIISDEAVKKGYVYFDKILNMKVFDMTYEDLKEYFGAEGQFVKEEYSDHMKCNYRYYKWISDADENTFIYINLKQDDDGIYRVSGYNSSGFTGSQAAETYLPILEEEEREKSRAAAASMKMNEVTMNLKSFGSSGVPLDVKVEIPEKEWSQEVSNGTGKIYNTEDLKNTFGVGFIQLKVDPEIEKFDFYKDKFENYKEIEPRTIGGVEMQGRTYKNIGYEWTEYIGHANDSAAISIGIVRLDISEGTVADRILNSISFR